MHQLKIQRVKFCTQCHEALPLKCSKCVKHPDRVPQVIEYYDWPEIVETCPCNGAVKVRCQRPGCEKITPWRWRTHNKGKMARAKSIFCSKQCGLSVLAESRKKRVQVPCGYCGKPKEVKLSLSKRSAFIFCHAEHYRLWKIGKSWEAVKKVVAEKEATDGKSLMWCDVCNDVTNHQDIINRRAQCQVCRAKKSTVGSGPDMAGPLKGLVVR